MKYAFFLLALLVTGVLHASNLDLADHSDDFDGEDARACLIDDGSREDEGWALLENSIPPCRRAFVALDQGAELDLGEKPVSKTFKTGMIAFKAKVISGSGSYTLSGKKYSLKGVTLWVSMDRCEMRSTLLMDAAGRDVTSFKKARRIKTTEEVNAIADGAELKHFENDCPKR